MGQHDSLKCLASEFKYTCGSESAKTRPAQARPDTSETQVSLVLDDIASGDNPASTESKQDESGNMFLRSMYQMAAALSPI